jgi:hypothetical protein
MLESNKHIAQGPLLAPEQNTNNLDSSKNVRQKSEVRVSANTANKETPILGVNLILVRMKSMGKIDNSSILLVLI